MAIQSSFYGITALSSRTFPSTKHIATKQHVAIWRRQLIDNNWFQMDISDYQLINNSCVLNTLLNTSVYDNLEVRVADDPNELTTNPGDLSIVAGIANEIITVADISTDVTTVAAISTDVTTVANISADVTIVANSVDEIAEVIKGNYVKWVDIPTVAAGDTAIASNHNLVGVSVYLNGVLLRLGIDYTETANSITLTTPIEENNGNLDELTLIGGEALDSASYPLTRKKYNVVSDTSVFTYPENLTSGSCVYINGILLEQIIDYTFLGSEVTLVTSAINGDLVEILNGIITI